MAARLFGSYPNAKAHDPEIFTAVVVKLFLQYERQVVAYVVELLPGQKTDKWDGLPSYAVIKEALDNRATRLAIDRERENRIARQLAERAEAERQEAEMRASGERDRIAAGLTGLRDALGGTLRTDDDAAEAERKARQTRLFDRANQAYLVRMGGEPGDLVSLALRALLASRSPERSAEVG